jgi:hypothetical protein
MWKVKRTLLFILINLFMGGTCAFISLGYKYTLLLINTFEILKSYNRLPTFPKTMVNIFIYLVAYKVFNIRGLRLF